MQDHPVARWAVEKETDHDTLRVPTTKEHYLWPK